MSRNLPNCKNCGKQLRDVGLGTATRASKNTDLYQCPICNKHCHPIITGLLSDAPTRGTHATAADIVHQLNRNLLIGTEAKPGQEHVMIDCETHKRYAAIHGNLATGCDMHFRCDCGHECCFECGWRDHRPSPSIRGQGGGGGGGAGERRGGGGGGEVPIVQVMTIADANSLFLWSPTRGYCTIPSTTPNLSQLIKQRADDNSFFSDEELSCFAVQIGAALNILHGGGKVPVNIKTQDIFIENNKTIKIASVPMFVSAAHNPDTELLKEEDLFDLGCIFLEMIDLRKPRSNDAERIIAAEICNNPSQAEMSPLASALRQLGCKMVSTAIPSSRPSAGTVFMTLLTTVTKAPPIHKAFKEIGVFSLIYKCLLQNGTFQYFYEIWDAVTRLIESKDDAQLFLDSKLLELGTTNFVVMYEDMITGCGKLPLAPLKSGSSDDGRNVFRINTFTGIVTSLFLYCNVMRDFPHLEALLTLNVVPTLTNVLDQYSITVQSRESETHLDIFAFACSILLSLILLPGNRTAPAQPNMFFEHFKDTDCLPVLLKLFGILNQFISSHSLSSSSSTPPYNSFHIQTRVYVAVIIACLLKGKRPDVAAFPHGEMHAAVMAALFFLSGLHGHPLPPEIQDDEVGEYVGNAWTGVVDGDTVLKEYNEKK